MAYELKTAVAKVGPKRSNFSLYKGPKAEQIVISSGPPGTQIIQELTKECGKPTLIAKGVCFREGDLLVFATKAPPAPAWKAQISKILKERKCQGVSNIELRQLGEGESDEVSGESEGGGGAGGGVPGAKGALLSAKWESARDAAMRGVEELVAKLNATGDADAARAGEIVEQLAEGFPAGLESAYASFDKATASGDAKGISSARGQAKAQTEACIAYLKGNQEIIGMCEANPFGANVTISKPLTEALLSISAQLD